MVMLWEDITVSVADKKLLSGITGIAEAGRIMAVIGRLPVNVVVTGDILINGKRSLYSREVSYVAQEELFLGTLTVKETLTYSANMRLPSKMTKEEIDKVVEETIVEMGLEDCADTRIGNWHCRGISNGEKKRLSIGLEILTQPYVLLLDEPTTGLDSASAFYVIQSLCHNAHNGKIVICSIHQPSSETFNIFDDLLLLSSGETVYFGEANMALKFFADAGLPCPSRRNPSDHFLLCINLDFDLVTSALARAQLDLLSSSNSALGAKKAEIRETLIRSYEGSRLMINARRRIQQLKANVFYGERSKGHYGEAAFVVSNIISSFPFIVLTSLSSGLIIYFMVQLHPGLVNFAFFCINLFCCLSVVECCMMIVASVVPNVLMGLGTGTGVILFMMMSSQLVRPLHDIPKIFWRYPMSYLSFTTWAVQVQCVSPFILN
uniref:ABC transporter domain-containing protein n=1 Tax=Glycine max TaxID=3847 RepID=A0A0R0KR27_SOYBN